MRLGDAFGGVGDVVSVSANVHFTTGTTLGLGSPTVTLRPLLFFNDLWWNLHGSPLDRRMPPPLERKIAYQPSVGATRFNDFRLEQNCLSAFGWTDRARIATIRLERWLGLLSTRDAHFDYAPHRPVRSGVALGPELINSGPLVLHFRVLRRGG